MLTLLAIVSPSTRAFGGCLFAAVVINLILTQSRFERRRHRASYRVLRSASWVFMLAAIVFLLLEPLG